ncbi:MAG: hypothetical protein WC878_04580 [Candidatus Paceibacterota bacterium]|jgi:hypothetical protein
MNGFLQLNFAKKIILIAGLLFFFGAIICAFLLLPEKFVSSDYSSFDIENRGSPPHIDQKIIGIRAKNGKKTAIVSNVRKVAGFADSEILEKIAYIPEFKKIILLQKMQDEDAGTSTPGVLWEWDGETGELQKMALNKYYSGFGVLATSPNQKYAAYIDANERKSIHLFDLVRDTDRILATVGDKLILANGKPFRGLGWVDDNIIEYAVYDATHPSTTDPGIYPNAGASRVFLELPCVDSDGGNTISVKGTLDGPKLVNGGSPIDFCVNGDILLEYSCSWEGGFTQNNFGTFSKSVPCENGCSDGICSKKPELEPLPPPASAPATTIDPKENIYGTTLFVRSVRSAGKSPPDSNFQQRDFYQVEFEWSPAAPWGATLAVWSDSCRSNDLMWSWGITRQGNNWENNLFRQGTKVCAQIVDYYGGVSHSNPVIITAFPWNAIAFSAPFPVSWKNEIRYSLSGVAIGDMYAPAHLFQTRENDYREGEKIHALVLSFNISVPLLPNTDHFCPKINLKRIINEKGDFVLPNSKQFFSPKKGLGGNLSESPCYRQDAEYEDQKLIFVVPPSEKDFMFFVGDEQGTVFTVFAGDDGDIGVKRECKNEECAESTTQEKNKKMNATSTADSYKLDPAYQGKGPGVPFSDGMMV